MIFTYNLAQWRYRMSVLSLFLFGPPRIEIDGTSLSVDTRKAVALIAYLAITRQQHSRDSLATLLWSENDQFHARADLQIDVQVFWRLLAECRIHGHPANETCTACEQPLTAAVALYQNDFLAGFSLRDSPQFDDWQLYQSDKIGRAH